MAPSRIPLRNSNQNEDIIQFFVWKCTIWWGVFPVPCERRGLAYFGIPAFLRNL